MGDGAAEGDAGKVACGVDGVTTQKKRETRLTTLFQWTILPEIDEESGFQTEPVRLPGKNRGRFFVLRRRHGRTDRRLTQHR